MTEKELLEKAITEYKRIAELFEGLDATKTDEAIKQIGDCSLSNVDDRLFDLDCECINITLENNEGKWHVLENSIEVWDNSRFIPCVIFIGNFEELTKMVGANQ